VKGCKVEITGGFLLETALLYYLDRDSLFPWAALACTLHEVGHWAAIRLLGGRVVRLRLTAWGAEMRLSAARPLSHGQMIAAALAGPAANLLLALLSALLARRGLGWRLYLFTGLNLGLACFNLLPASWLDGGRALRSTAALLRSEGAGERLADAVSLGTAVFTALCGGLLLWWSGGTKFTLLLMGLWLGGMTLTERGQRTF